MTRLCSLMVVACAAGAIGLSATRAAADLQDLHGGFCHPRSANTSVQYTNYGFVNNSTTATITAECPFSPTYNNSNCIPRFSEVGVFAYDRNPSKNVTCTLKYLKLDGDIVTTLPPKSTPGSTSTALSIVFAGLSSLTGGVLMYMTCSVPPKASNGL
jgi:hypothetical protein